MTNSRSIKMENGKLNVPDHPIIPFIEGDGIGPDIWNASVNVFDNAVQSWVSMSVQIVMKNFGKMNHKNTKN